MATIFLDEEKIVDPTHEKRFSTASSYEVVLHGIPTPPHELDLIVQKKSLPSVTIAFPDEALPNQKQHCHEDTTPRDHFVTAELPTLSILGRPLTGTAVKQSNLALETAIDRGSTPPLSIHQTSESSLTTGRQQSSETKVNDHPYPQYFSGQSSTTGPSHGHESLSNSATDFETAKGTPGTQDVKTNKADPQTIEPILPDLQAIATIGQGCFISHTQLVPEDYRRHWTAVLKSRIDETLLQELPPSNDNQSSLVLVLRMAGTRRRDLRPSILVTCCSDNDISDSSLSSTIGDVSETNSIEVDDAVEPDTIKLSHDGINLRPGVTQDLAFRTLEYGGMCLPCTSRFENASIRSSVRASDWAVFSAGDSSDGQQAINSIHIPGQHELTFIESTRTKAELREGQVWIAAGSGLYSGILNPVPASILIRNSICEVREISLTSPLVEGDSGSWVVQEGRLCGMIVAGSSFPPWAYMLLVEDIFSEIASCLPEVLSVSLSTRTETGNHSSLSTTSGAERRETVEALRPPPRQVHFELPASEEVPGNVTSRLHMKTQVSNLDMPIHNPLGQPTIGIRNLFSCLSFGLLGKETASGTENLSNIPQQSNQVRQTTRKKVRHYPRSPARARREAALHSRSPPRAT
ncbi:hypothetical protein VTL71DRAFT_9484 [Oculimacula yallundae]|uniref:Uncharacterized protein n=1 Tax=Oculimacula yallundae TaxID=86028 RepID=A0ABR4BS52_9HELO